MPIAHHVMDHQHLVLNVLIIIMLILMKHAKNANMLIINLYLILEIIVYIV